MIKVLHVEDDRDICEIVKLCLEMSGGFTIVQFTSGEAAVRNASAQSADVMVLDMMKPGTSGIQTLELLRQHEHLETIPAIFMTARIRKSEQDALKAAGAAGVISKPFDPLTLADDIKDILLGAL